MDGNILTPLRLKLKTVEYPGHWGLLLVTSIFSLLCIFNGPKETNEYVEKGENRGDEVFTFEVKPLGLPKIIYVLGTQLFHL